MKIKIYVVSLKEAKERRKHIKTQLEKINIEYEIIDAIYGKSLSNEELKQKCDMEIVNKYPNWLTKGAIGCALSHYKIYNKILQDGVDYGIVLEDDAKLLPKFEKVITIMINKNLLSSDTVTLLFTQNIRGEQPTFSTIDEKNIIDNFTLNYPINFNSITTALGYIISSKLALNLSNNILPIRMASDSWNHFLSNKWIDKVNCVLPYIVTPYGFESQIGYGGGNKIKQILSSFFPQLYKLLVMIKTRYYLKKVSKYKKINKKHIFIE